MQLKAAYLIIFSLLMPVLAAGIAEGGEYNVIVNAKNPVVFMSKNEVSALFLKRVTRWNDGTRVMPVDLKPDSHIREEFSKDIHKKSIRSVRAYWDVQLFAGYEVPAPEKANEMDVLRYVLKNPGAIGYVSALTRVGSGIKVVVVDDSNEMSQ